MPGQTSNTASTASISVVSANGIETALLRFGLAVVLLFHSGARFGIGPYDPMSISGFAGFLGSLGVPAAGLMAWVITLVEFVGGLLILVGLLTRVAAALVAANMFLALVLVHWPGGFAEQGTSIELTGLMVLVAISLAVRGAGKLSIEEGYSDTKTRSGPDSSGRHRTKGHLSQRPSGDGSWRRLYHSER